MESIEMSREWEGWGDVSDGYDPVRIPEAKNKKEAILYLKKALKLLEEVGVMLDGIHKRCLERKEGRGGISTETITSGSDVGATADEGVAGG